MRNKQGNWVVVLLICVIYSMTCLIPLEVVALGPDNSSGMIDDELFTFAAEVSEGLTRLFESWGGTYPEYYAGAYMDGLNFYILVTDMATIPNSEFSNAMGSVNYQFVQAKYPYLALEAVYNDIKQRFCYSEIPEEIRKAVYGWGIIQRDNCIEITVAANSNVDAELLAFLGYDPEMIRIVHSEYGRAEPLVSNNVTAGRKYYATGTYGGQSTIGFCASRSVNGETEYGFVLAGHAVSRNETIYINGTAVGTVSKIQYSDNCDAAFVRMNDTTSNYVPSNRLSSSYIIDGYRYVYGEGMPYVAHGMSSGLVTGTVYSTSACSTVGSITLTDMIQMNMGLVSGDSGAPLVGENNQYSRYLIGTCSAGNGVYTYFSKYTNIMSKLGITALY